MDGLQIQIVQLHHKIDQLYEMVEQLSSQIKTLMPQKQANLASHTDILPDEPRMGSYTITHKGSSHTVLEHKDILADGNHSNNHTNGSSEQTLSPDIQVRRLTAQLTAAYNRIAALEEQLLTYRIHF
jgi:hypothetical protein